MRILIAVPVFNEEKYVGRVLSEIRREAGKCTDVLVIDDGSTDSTPELLGDLAQRKAIALLTHPENRGYGQSLIDAFKFASRHGYDWVITMDCDEQHEPSRIGAFKEACRRNNIPGPSCADIISGSRYLQTEQNADHPPADRRSINRIITDMLNSTLGYNLTDSFCGFKAHRVSAMEKLDLTIPGYAFPMQFWVQAQANGLQVQELPVRLIYKDATRHFGGTLDDPTARLQHYLEVLSAEMAKVRAVKTPADACCDAACTGQP